MKFRKQQISIGRNGGGLLRGSSTKIGVPDSNSLVWSRSERAEFKIGSGNGKRERLEELLYFIRSSGELIIVFFSSCGTLIKIKTKLN